MRLKKGISVQTYDEFVEFARIFNLERPNWTLKTEMHHGSLSCSLTHRPYKRYKISNSLYPSRESQVRDAFAWDYTYAAQRIFKEGAEVNRKFVLNFGFNIAYRRPGEDRYTLMQLRLDKGRKSEIKKTIATANAIKNKHTR